MSNWTEPPPPRPETFPDEIEKIKGIVGKYFPIYNVRVQFDTISLFCNIEPAGLEGQFETLRKEMKKAKYIPILTKERGEYIIHVVRQPKMKFKSINVNIFLLVATIFTTILAGSVLWAAVSDSDDFLSSTNLLNGALYFALPLMLILGVHELAHYYAAKRHGIAASLPFFIPIPPFFGIPIGTMGAFISIREPIPSKKALLDIGVSGPIAGLLVAIPVTIIGLLLTSPVEAASAAAEGGAVSIGDSILFFSFRAFLPIPENLFIHPLAFAGWVGLFVTALNLLPAGQLDGGHIARALFGEKARFVSYGAFALMIGLGLFTVYSGWLIFALLIMLLGMRHPPPLNDITGLDKRRKALGVVTAGILILCFVPVPFFIEEPVYDVDFIIIDDGNIIINYWEDPPSVNITEQSLPQNMSFEVDLRLVNNGNTQMTVSFESSSNSSFCNVTFVPESDPTNASESIRTEIPVHDSENVTVNIDVPANTIGNYSVTVSVSYSDQYGRVGASGHGLTDEVIIYLNLRN